ncbi:hypothetical protein EXIGLDRAFT_727702 [Exidia glandulosa HHB12029]|uniref:Secreted protein n=1 Tax=Exidia glandulosa HHB12029 TaxID=1314781 RepID=A0A165ZMC8_EXIGL|nr:hypothetical protein EXIGLDRAFT_727702 [Exidia glandulosa HHB12029]
MHIAVARVAANVALVALVNWTWVSAVKALCISIGDGTAAWYAQAVACCTAPVNRAHSPCNRYFRATRSTVVASLPARVVSAPLFASFRLFDCHSRGFLPAPPNPDRRPPIPSPCPSASHTYTLSVTDLALCVARNQPQCSDESGRALVSRWRARPTMRCCRYAVARFAMTTCRPPILLSFQRVASHCWRPISFYVVRYEYRPFA